MLPSLIIKPVRAPVAEAKSKGTRELSVKSMLKSSNVKMMAATGAPNMEAMAPAVAQAINKMRCLKPRRIQRARLEPMADPVPTAGPSNPTDPPKPTVMAEVKNDVYILDRGMMPPWREMASMAEGMPSPARSLKTRTKATVSRMPTKGKAK